MPESHVFFSDFTVNILTNITPLATAKAIANGHMDATKPSKEAHEKPPGQVKRISPFFFL